MPESTSTNSVQVYGADPQPPGFGQESRVEIRRVAQIRYQGIEKRVSAENNVELDPWFEEATRAVRTQPDELGGN